MKPATTTWLLAGMLAVTLATAHHLDDANDERGQWPASTLLQELQASAAGTVRRERAAQALCASERGLNSESRWTAEGDLVCSTRRGFVTAAKAVRP